MIVAVVVLGLVALGLAYALIRREEDHDAQILKLDERHRKERYDLTSRIQRPNYTPATEPVAQREPKDRDDLARIGTKMQFPRNDASVNG